MGMFDKDREFGMRPEATFGEGTEFVLLDAYLSGKTLDTQFGKADVATLVGCKVNGSRLSDPIVTSTVASAIVDKVKEADPDDFPAVVMLQRVKGRYRADTLVIQFVAPWKGATPSYERVNPETGEIVS